jgi:hypothetical protein
MKKMIVKKTRKVKKTVTFTDDKGYLGNIQFYIQIFK